MTDTAFAPAPASEPRLTAALAVFNTIAPYLVALAILAAVIANGSPGDFAKSVELLILGAALAKIDPNTRKSVTP